MFNTVTPTQIGFIPTGANGTVKTSSLYLGKNVDVTWEAVGLGAQGRPDYLQVVNLNLTKVVGTSNPILTRLGTISFDVSDLQTIIAGNSNATAAALTFKLREVDVCDSTTARKMMVLSSLPYDP